MELFVNLIGRKEFINLSQIAYFETDAQGATLHLSNGKEIALTKEEYDKLYKKLTDLHLVSKI